jgi:hypothetical protein
VGAIIVYYDYLMYGIEDMSGWSVFELEDGWDEKVWMRDQEMGTYHPQSHGIMSGIVACHHKVTCCRVTSKDLAASQW